MIKELWTDYIIHWNMQHFKEQNKNTNGGLIMIPLWIIAWSYMGIPESFDFNTMDSIRTSISFFTYVLTLTFVLFSILLHPLTPNKMWYLCPMEKKERLAAVKRSWIFRGILHFIIIFTVFMVNCLLHHFHPALIPVMILNLIGLCFMPGEFYAGYAGSNTMDGILSFFIYLDGIFLNVLDFYIICEYSYSLFELILLISLTVLQLSLYLHYKKYIKEEFLSATDYEKRTENLKKKGLKKT